MPHISEAVGYQSPDMPVDWSTCDLLLYAVGHLSGNCRSVGHKFSQVHGSQSIEILKPLPKESGDGWRLVERIVSVHENKSGIIVERENILSNKNGVPYARLFFLLQPRCEDHWREVLYRLIGDPTPPRIDPEVGQATGFEGGTLLGLCTIGFVSRSIVAAVGNNDPSSLVYYRTSIWEVGPGPNGTTELAFEAKDLTTGKIALGLGVAYVKKQQSTKL